MMSAASVYCPTEDQEQAALFEWAQLQTGKYPELRLLYAIPNGSLRHIATAARLKATGVKAGVPDIALPVPRGKYASLYIELKRQRGGRVSESQKQWIETLREQGNATAVCAGWEAAAAVITQYLSGQYEQQSYGVITAWKP